MSEKRERAPRAAALVPGLPLLMEGRRQAGL